MEDVAEVSEVELAGQRITGHGYVGCVLVTLANLVASVATSFPRLL